MFSRSTRFATSTASSGGFSLIEVMMVVGIIGVLAVISVPMTGNALRYIRISGDARDLSNSISVAKMRAASKFTKSRLFVDLAGKTFYIQTYEKTATAACTTPPCWVNETSATSLSSTVSFDYAPVAAAPPDTQTTIDQAPECRTLDATPVDIADSACIIFNSRGLPILSVESGAPTGDNAIYMTDGSAVYGITVAATGFIRLWRTNAATAPTWTLQ
jgi:prepilin-type N-terminal cleavage/methylation domain-containing protein